MKVIELAFKISMNRLEDMTKVFFKKHNCLTIYHKKENRFEFVNKGDWDNYFSKLDINELNDEVEIVEEKSNIPSKISYQQIGRYLKPDDTELIDGINNQIKQIGSKVNEIIDYLKESEK